MLKRNLLKYTDLSNILATVVVEVVVVDVTVVDIVGDVDVAITKVLYMNENVTYLLSPYLLNRLAR
jgi:hypothetical protein